MVSYKMSTLALPGRVDAMTTDRSGRFVFAAFGISIVVFEVVEVRRGSQPRLRFKDDMDWEFAIAEYQGTPGKKMFEKRRICF